MPRRWSRAAFRSPASTKTARTAARPSSRSPIILQTADAGRGQAVFQKCQACHTVNQGGANGLGPNLHGTMGATLAHVAGFAYSDALRSKGGSWDWEKMSQWLRSPRTFAPGTKMTFAGLSNPQDRADVMVYLNSQGGAPHHPAAARRRAGRGQCRRGQCGGRQCRRGERRRARRQRRGAALAVSIFVQVYGRHGRGRLEVRPGG